MLLTHVVAMYDAHVTVQLVEQQRPTRYVNGKIRPPPIRMKHIAKYKTLDDIPDPKIRDRVAVLKLVPVSDAIEGYGIRASENIFWITTIGENEYE